jgi:hypothetical protein
MDHVPDRERQFFEPPRLHFPKHGKRLVPEGQEEVPLADRMVTFSVQANQGTVGQTAEKLDLAAAVDERPEGVPHFLEQPG